jgi:large subunit ribosomal protein L21
MEAIISDSGRQFKVSEGSTIDVDYRELEPGSSIEFDKVLYLSSGSSTPSLGQPFLDGAKVVGKVVGKIRGPKLIVTHFRRRKNSRTRVGHRQSYTKILIESIQA